MGSVLWLCRKFKNAAKRQTDTQSQLDMILKLPNPFEESEGNYTISFFKKQWIDQRSFQADHTNEEQERRKQLIDLYEHWSTLEVLKWVNPLSCSWLFGWLADVKSIELVFWIRHFIFFPRKKSIKSSTM
jgi:hypothetical protein